MLKNIKFIKLRMKLDFLKILSQRALYVLKTRGIWFCCKKIPIFINNIITSKRASRDLNNLLQNLNNISDDTLMVSFVIPIYNRTDVLREAINSALQQTYQNIEVILVTDGSPQETLDVVNEFIDNNKVKIFHYPTSSGNAVRGRNKGILEAQGKYIAFLDSDDIAAPDRVINSLAILESGAADVVYGSWKALLDGSRAIDGLVNGQVVSSPDCDLNLLLEICVPCQSTVTVRRDLFFKVGFLKSKMQYREDHELWVRLAYFGAKFRSIPHVLSTLRLHEGNNEINFKQNDSFWYDLLLSEYKIKAIIPKKITFLVHGLGKGGGTNVIVCYANHLLSLGHDVQLLNVKHPVEIYDIKNNKVPVVNIHQKNCQSMINIDILIATFWSTCELLDKIPATRKLYFVQADERLFYETKILKSLVAETYKLNCEYITVSSMLSDMLKVEFNQIAKIIQNGLDTNIFYPREPIAPKNQQRLRVLLEGPLSIPFKGVSDAYHAIKDLDCEIWLISSDGYPDPSWKIDRFFYSVEHEVMPEIYSSCDILLKMSRVESFSYPPLEAMACGCAVVVSEIPGAMSYAMDEVNALIVKKQDIVGARNAVQRLCVDQELRNRLVIEGYKAVKDYELNLSLNNLENIIANNVSSVDNCLILD